MVKKREFKTLTAPSDKYHELCKLCKTTGKRDTYDDQFSHLKHIMILMALY